MFCSHSLYEIKSEVAPSFIVFIVPCQRSPLDGNRQLMIYSDRTIILTVKMCRRVYQCFYFLLDTWYITISKQEKAKTVGLQPSHRRLHFTSNVIFWLYIIYIEIRCFVLSDTFFTKHLSRLNNIRLVHRELSVWKSKVL